VTAVDVGACTGGFTQVLLERGARHVTAVDVGHGQLAAELRRDPRVTDLSGHNVRDLEAAEIGGPADFVVADLSFISLTVVMERLRDLTRPGGELLLLVKPQFEVGRAGLDGRGVVRSDALRRQALLDVLRSAYELGLDLRGAVPSRTPGQEGNVEYLLWLSRPTDAPVGSTWQSGSRIIDEMLEHRPGPSTQREGRGRQ
jgi:23S rRNA (cytidine1920-2'-O)/16S rRNA (cytidine1409-2'-O)-methyltransferase